MDPVAHTLFGAALARAGLGRLSRHATAALLIGANLPDIDVVAQLWGSDTALYARRGWTHGVLSMAVLPLLLTAALIGWDRWRRRSRDDAPPLRPRALLLACCIGIWSHPLLDWLNTYGVRLLMPFDGRWFYGDTLFIVDPWVWLLLAAGLVLAHSTRWPSKLAWALLGGIATWLLLSRDLPPAVTIVWCIGLAAIVLMRWRLPAGYAARLAQFGVAATLLHAGVLFGLARQAEAAALVRFPDAHDVQANPAPAQPLAHRVVLAWPDGYRIVEADGRVRELPRAPQDDVVRRALADPSIRGFANWTRFPWWQVEPQADGWRVHLHDLRYSRPGDRGGGIGYATVFVPR